MLTVTFQRLSKYSNIYTDWQRQERGAWKGHMLVHWAREQTPGRSRRVRDAGSVPAWRYRLPRTGTGRLARLGTSRASPPAETRAAAGSVGSAAPAGAPAAFWKLGCSSGRARAGVCSGAGEKRKMKGGTKKSPGQGQVTAG